MLADHQAFSQSRAGDTQTGFGAVRWANQNFAGNKVPPFSFVYGGKESKTFITGWEFRSLKLPQSDPAIQNMKDFRRLQPYYYGDYYPLVPNVNITSDSIRMPVAFHSIRITASI